MDNIKIQQFDETVSEVSKILEELAEDTTIPKNVKLKISSTLVTLKEEKDGSIRVHKALNALGEIADDANIQPYTRTQIWNIVSILEKL